MNTPCVSVIMSVYNGADLAPKAIDSILAQTYNDFELIVIENGSFKDDTRATLNRLSDQLGDERLKVFELDENIGLAGALNYGISLARGQLIARQDHDDISLPRRLEKQVAYMKSHSDCGLLGTAADIWINEKPTGRMHEHATNNAALQVDLLSNNPFVHTSIMTRRAVLERCGAYTRDPGRQPPEDYELWSRIARSYTVANLPETLVVYREVPESMSRDANNPFQERLLLISAENIAFWNGVDANDRHCRAAAALIHGAYERVPPDARIEPIVERLAAAVDAIEAKFRDGNLSRSKDQLIANARHHYMHARVLPNWVKPLVPIGRTLPVPARFKQHLASWLGR